MALATRRKPKSHNRKRQANHHRRTKQYHKAYLPYLPMLLVVGIGLAINSLWTPQAVLGANSDFSSGALLTATNQQRVAEKQTPLAIDSQLTQAAQAKAEDMAHENYWSHTSPDGETPWSFISASGYQYQLAGENLAYGFADASQTIAGWMNSPEHRANILNADYQNVGFGVASVQNFQGKGPQIIIVAEYAKPVDAVATITFSVPETAQNSVTTNVQGASREVPAQPVSRIAVLTNGQATWVTLAVGIITGAALAVFLTRHGFRLHRTLVRGEAFIAHHPKLDLAVVVLITAGFLLTRSSGIIR